MARYSRSTRGTPDLQRQTSERLVRYDGIFTAIVKDNRDFVTNGRLRVWIPEFATDELDDTGWISVSYAPPFAGATPVFGLGKDLTDYTETQTSYGMWFIPPDVENTVLIAFAGGDPGRGFWFACTYNNFMNQMVPANGSLPSSLHYGPNTSDSCDLPVGEYNKNSKIKRDTQNPDKEKKPVHIYHTLGLRDQGLIFDEVRGITDASARRESPSSVFGISTPGPLDKKSDGNFFPYKTINSGSTSEPTYVHRKGGHQFVLDDNDKDEYIRLRTRSGGQIKIDETNGIIYLINSTGKAWLEFSESGFVDIYGASSMSLRSKMDVNIRADRDLNLEAGRNVNVRAAKDYLSFDDAVQLLQEYANTQKKNIVDCFTDDDKRAYINDFPFYKQELGKKSVKEVFIELLTDIGYPTSGSTELFFDDTQSNPSISTLSAVKLLSILRGSNIDTTTDSKGNKIINSVDQGPSIVGEGFGSGGQVKIQANNTLDISSQKDFKLTSFDGDVHEFVGGNFKQTIGINSNIFVGTDEIRAVGNNLSIATGAEMITTSGGHYHMSVYGDMHVYTRGDMDFRLEGLRLNMQAIPYKFKDDGSGREAITDQTHSVNLNLQEINLNAGNFYGNYAGDIVNPEGDWNLTVGGYANITAPQYVTLDTPTLHSPQPQNGDGGGGQPAIPPPSGPTVDKADKAPIGEFAKLAVTPNLFSKNNVLEVLEYLGNQQYCLTYHTQIVESIISRLPTHEPCVEHEFLGDLSKKPQDFQMAVSHFRNLE